MQGRHDVIEQTKSKPESRQMDLVIKHELCDGDDVVRMAKPTDPNPNSGDVR